jgi:hypothetical protein
MFSTLLRGKQGRGLPCQVSQQLPFDSQAIVHVKQPHRLMGGVVDKKNRYFAHIHEL